MEVDYRTEAQKQKEEEMRLKPRQAINSDTEEDDSSEDEDTRMAKALLFSSSLANSKRRVSSGSDSDI